MNLLAHNASKLERNLSQLGDRITGLPILHASLWNAATCPLALLPWIAAALSVDEWDDTWPEAMKREAIATSLDFHRIQGTVLAIRKTLDFYGHTDAEIIERADCVRRDGSANRNGLRRRGGLSQWATVRIVLHQRMTLDLAEQLLRRIQHAKRLCVHVVGLNGNIGGLRRNGIAHRDGTHHRGLIA
ncbi:tail protein [Ferriphaselus amnicola]|uniref:Tail protein n=1 Tax=Ferriphaselus amnicola TaxID=1188319 RepID=A0A2Z6GC43_9PROT|nr:phage tail protein I [Ferriphaselus amnicola]BBE51143.1 tail protein [Ferriphaselus amnicola]